MIDIFDNSDEDRVLDGEDTRFLHQRVYGILHTRTLEENREFYKITTIFLTLLTGISGFGFSFDEHAQIVFSMGLAISLVWFLAALSQVMWKRWWQGRYESMEKIVYITDELRAMRERGRTRTPRIFGVALRLTFILLVFPGIFTFVCLKGLGAPSWSYVVIAAQVLLSIYASYRYEPFRTH